MNDEPVHLATQVARLLEEATVSDISLHERELRLSRPLETARGAIETRRVILVRVVVAARGVEVEGWGEAAPLEGWSEEALSHARYDLVRVRDRVFAAGPSAGDALLRRIRPASARFAFSSALLDAVAKAHNRPLRRVIDATAPNSIALNATIGFGTPADASAAARAALESGFSTLKVKVGGDAEVDVARIAAIREVSRELRLRLDANGAWAASEAIDVLGRLAEFDVDYVEQPTPADDIDGLARVRANAQVDVAADESCFPSERAIRIVSDEIVDVVVVKPSLYGSWGEVAELMDAARASATRVVFTSAIDGIVARSAVAQMAAAWLGGEVACGLATGSWFERDHEGREEFVRGGRLFLGSGGGIGFGLAASLMTGTKS